MTLTLVIFLAVVALLWVGLWLSPDHRIGFAQTLDAPDSGAELADTDGGPAPADTGSPVDDAIPPITVFAPARNEGRVLPRTVPTFCQQLGVTPTVLIVDDQSDDDTAEVLGRLTPAFANLRVMTTGERPPGWMGKTWAVHSGVASLAYATPSTDPGAGQNPPAFHHASDDSPEAQPLYCFTDADCAFHPAALRTAWRAMRQADADMLSVLPRMKIVPVCERIGLPGLVTVLGLVFPLGRVNRPDSPLALAAGGFILMTRAAYERVGGHESVRFHIVEDVNLARRAKSMGLRLHTRFTRNLVTTHMYENWRDLWEGLSKNAYAGMDYQPRKFWVGAVVGIAVMVLPPLYVAITAGWAVSTWRPGSQPSLGSAGTAPAIVLPLVALALATLGYAAQCAVHARTIRLLGLSRVHALLMPVSIALYLAIAAASAYRHHFGGGTAWKGRTYRTTPG